jgi:DNA-binding MarR family transcriptional regulator
MNKPPTSQPPISQALDKSQFGYTIADIQRLLRRVFDRRAGDLGLTRAQWMALSRIERAEGLTQTELAQELDMETIAVGRVLDRLQAAGFVERRADPDDRRCWRLYRAPKSDEVMAGMKVIAGQLREEVLAGVDPDDFATTMRVLGKVKETLNKLDREGKTAPRKKDA